MLLHLFSDANYNLLGFNASFRFSLCPGGCQNHGQCKSPGVCVCEPGWGGPDCGLQECSAYCGSHGTCASVSCPPLNLPGILICDHTCHVWGLVPPWHAPPHCSGSQSPLLPGLSLTCDFNPTPPPPTPLPSRPQFWLCAHLQPSFTQE